jgi:hypothetical protein
MFDKDFALYERTTKHFSEFDYVLRNVICNGHEENSSLEVFQPFYIALYSPGSTVYIVSSYVFWIMYYLRSHPYDEKICEDSSFVYVS